MEPLWAVLGAPPPRARGGWTIKGNADQELSFVSPFGRTLTARPPPLLRETRRRIQDVTGLDLGRPDDR